MFFGSFGTRKISCRCSPTHFGQAVTDLTEKTKSVPHNVYFGNYKIRNSSDEPSIRIVKGLLFPDFLIFLSYTEVQQQIRNQPH